jgi:molecular chaperone HtpG
MLRYLDWLIPPSTQKEMTPTDWLLITLTIYLHDLGMLVTAEEFDKRMENPTFRGFIDGIKNDPKSQDYLGRAKRMSEDEREKFFFQEFVRDGHSKRIKDWITGRHSRHWGAAIRPVAETVHKLLQALPARFRENLATVCESHHENNLNKLDLYPLCQPYGNDPLEMANVQFAALILRTADLIHVTKERTPSMMYKTIKLSDPKGVNEWDKQKDTFSVRHQGRTFDPNDASSHVITVSADFAEERPFFALTEYLSWADTEIKQTKRWSDQSRQQKDAANFWFPWHTIRGDLRVEGNQPQQMRFELDRGRLLGGVK